MKGCVTFSYILDHLKTEGISKNKILAGGIRSVLSVQVSLKKIEVTKMKQIVDRDFCNIWWLLKEPFVCESKLI